MRVSGVVQDARGFGAHDHLCWAYDDPAQFEVCANEFLGEGLAAGYRVCLVTSGPVRLPGLKAAIANGAARVLPVGDGYPGGVVDPAAQVAAYAAATDEALADGYAGLRVAADVTELVRTPAGLDAFARYEHLIDRLMVSRPMSALCAYDRRTLRDEVVTQLAVLHPAAGAEAPFHLYALASGLAFHGELDLMSHHLLARALERAAPEPVDAEIVFDAAKLTFVDHQSLILLGQYARGQGGATAVLRSAPPVAARIIEVLGLEHVRAESAP